MTILLVAATPFEIAPTLAWLASNAQKEASGLFRMGQAAVFPLVTGLGMSATSWHLGRFFASNHVDLAINAGIAGAFDTSLYLGDVVQVVSERFGDLGVEEADGRFTDLFELGFWENDGALFSNNQMVNPGAALQKGILPPVSGLTVNKVHGHAPSIEAIRQKYPDAQVESMEGAAFFHACLLAGTPFMQIRAISNHVEARNREAWDIPLAVERLNGVLKECLGI